jgi:hypothetical protein
MDVIPGRGELSRPDPDDPPVDLRSYSDLPDRSGKWPRPVRVIFIAGSAAILWGLIFVGVRLL